MANPSRILVFALVLAVCPAFADDDRRGRSRGHGGGEGMRVEVRFSEPQRVSVNGWYASQIQQGHCPPGLAKKRNGCLPPGQAKKRWKLGRPLPREVIFHDLPPALVVELGVPPAGYRYVRIANDVLLIAVGTGMVIDAITDLGRL